MTIKSAANANLRQFNSQPVPNWVGKNQTTQQQQPKSNSKSAGSQSHRISDPVKQSKDSSQSLSKQLRPSSKERQIIQKLRKRDQEVRQHEQAHKTAGGPYAGSVSYTYQRGPDGNKYAVGGSVNIDTQPIPGQPKETVKKAKMVKQAALAPANPSAQDLKIASKAAQMKLEAKMKLNQQEKSSTQTRSKQQLTNYNSQSPKPDNQFSLIA